jgi:hypothetical protein
MLKGDPESKHYISGRKKREEVFISGLLVRAYLKA